MAAATWQIGVGEIEIHQDIGKITTVDEAIDGAPCRVRLAIDIDRPTIHGQVEVTTDGEERIAKGFEFQSANVSAPEEAVIGIDQGKTRIIGAAFLVDAGKHD